MLKVLQSLYLQLEKFFHRPHERAIRKALGLLLGNDGITLIDIGAAGGIEPRFKKIDLFLNYVCFEPDSRSRSKLNSNSNNCKSYRVLDTAILDSTDEVNLYLCSDPQLSSIYSPNLEFLMHFPKVERFHVVNKVTLRGQPLDVIKIDNPDFIKIDI